MFNAGGPHPGERLRSIDVARAIAVLLVLGTHLPFTWTTAPSRVVAPPALPPEAMAVSEYGQFGVHLFLVISGFCIHLRWARRNDQAQGIDFVRFWRRRLLRLYPPTSLRSSCH